MSLIYICRFEWNLKSVEENNYLYFKCNMFLLLKEKYFKVKLWHSDCYLFIFIGSISRVFSKPLHGILVANLENLSGWDGCFGFYFSAYILYLKVD